MELRPLALCGEPLQLQLSSFVAQPRRAVGLTIPYLCPTYLSQSGLFLVLLVTDNLSCLSSGYSQIFVLHGATVLVCLWEEVSSRSSCSRFLIYKIFM